MVVVVIYFFILFKCFIRYSYKSIWWPRNVYTTKYDI